VHVEAGEATAGCQQQEAEVALTQNETMMRGLLMGTKEDVVLVGNLIGKDRVNYVFMYVLSEVGDT
jgi:hypothetical protein